MSLQDQHIVIIGGSTGIGFATAQMALEQGAKVTIASHSKEKLERAKEKLNNKISVEILDITQEKSIESFFSKINKLDHLVTTASGDVFGSFKELTLEQAHHKFDNKFWGQYTVVKYAINKMKNSGSITLFAGVASQLPVRGLTCGAAINGAIEALGRSLALELAPIRVNTISPGAIDTEAWTTMSESERKQFFAALGKQLPVGRGGKPEDVAQAVLFLMQNGYMTGSTIYIEGGQRLGSTRS